MIIPVPIIRRRITIKRFLNAGAVDHSHAVDPINIKVSEGFIFSRLVSSGKIIKTDSGKYYVDVTKI